MASSSASTRILKRLPAAGIAFGYYEGDNEGAIRAEYNFPLLRLFTWMVRVYKIDYSSNVGHGIMVNVVASRGLNELLFSFPPVLQLQQSRLIGYCSPRRRKCQQIPLSDCSHSIESDRGGCMRPASAFQSSVNPVEVYEFKVERSGRGPSISWSYGRRAGSKSVADADSAAGVTKELAEEA
ncbi:hypothetical protein ARMGADRAFT_1039843 [Armillaria gallica]|uniref:Uncharacterized protein n=1 Tax=Armillaria gallica TaxID=47427 RepID=A0A2H3CZG0_ARMGA|nr:hypothetical protein ARMGADRAFT_1039843 [Armillaria gallica]